MRWWRVVAVVAGLLAIGVALQVSFLGRLGLPGSTPDLALVVVAAIGLAHGSTQGAVAGFAGGLLIDLAPPADHAVGQWALVLTVTGYAAGRLRPTGDALEVRPATVLGVGVLAGAGTLAALGVGAVVDGWWPGLSDAATFAGSAVAYGALLAAVVIPLVRRPLRWASHCAAGSRSAATGIPRPW